MIQTDRREFNGVFYDHEETEAWVKEMEARTGSKEYGYNSIAELGTKVIELREALNRIEEGKSAGFFLTRADATAYWNTAYDGGAGTAPSENFKFEILDIKEYHTFDASDVTYRTVMVGEVIELGDTPTENSKKAFTEHGAWKQFNKIDKKLNINSDVTAVVNTNFIEGHYISESTKELTPDDDFSYLKINLGNKTNILASFGKSGSSVDKVAYFKAEPFNTDNYISSESITTADEQVTDLLINPPENALLAVVSSKNTYTRVIKYDEQTFIDEKVRGRVTIAEGKVLTLETENTSIKERLNELESEGVTYERRTENLTVVPDYYVNITTKELTPENSFSYAKVLVENLGTDILAGFGKAGGSVAKVAYYNSDTTFNEATNLGIETVVTAEEQATDFPLTLPNGTVCILLSTKGGYTLSLSSLFAIPIEDEVTKEDFDALSGRVTTLETPEATSRQNETLKTVHNYYIDNTTKEPTNLNGYMYAKVEIASLGTDILASFGKQGSSVAKIVYYNSSVLNSANHVSTESITTANEQETNFPINPPETATYLTISSNDTYTMSLSSIKPILEEESDFVKFNRSLNTLLETNQMYFSMRNSVFNEAANMIIKQSYEQNNLKDAHDFVQIYGQSNADNRIPWSSAPQWLIDLNGFLERIMLFNRTTGKFAPYQVGHNTGADNNEDTRFGFDVFFYKAWMDANPGKTLYVYKKTKGGTPIAGTGGNASASWNPIQSEIEVGRRSLCAEIIDEVAVLKSLNVDLKPIGILFSQGESDADIKGSAVTLYPQRLRNLINFLRSVFMCHNNKFVNLQLASGHATEYDTINSQFADLNLEDDRSVTIDMSAQGTLDGIHFDLAAVEYAGNEMFNELAFTALAA